MNQHLKLAYDHGAQRALQEAGITKVSNPIARHIRASTGSDVRRLEQLMDEIPGFNPLGLSEVVRNKRIQRVQARNDAMDALMSRSKLHDAVVGEPYGMHQELRGMRELGGSLVEALEAQSKARTRNLAAAGGLGGLGLVGGSAYQLAGDN